MHAYVYIYKYLHTYLCSYVCMYVCRHLNLRIDRIYKPTARKINPKVML